MISRIEKYLENQCIQSASSNDMPIPLVRQFAVNSQNQSPYDWNGTLKMYTDRQILWQYYLNNLANIQSLKFKRKKIIQTVNDTIDQLQNMLVYFYIDPPDSIKTDHPAMDKTVAYKIVEIILDGEDFIHILTHYNDDYLKRKIFSMASWCPAATALVIVIITGFVGIARPLLT